MTRTSTTVVSETTMIPVGVDAVVVHGGVDMEPVASTFRVLERAAAVAREALRKGVRGVQAAVEAVGVLEDEPSFNAGFGAVLTSDGTVETDGAVAEGGTGRIAGVGAVPGIRNPAALALRLLDRGDVALLVGPAALDFALTQGFRSEDLVSGEQRTALAEILSKPGGSVFTGRPLPTETVGCIVVDATGISLASSTGGLVAKLPGRVGDASVPGAGFWADERIGVLCSGSGETSIRRVMAFVVAGRVREFGLREAVERTVQDVIDASPDAISAIVAVDRMTGEVATTHAGSSFPVAVLSDGEPARLGARG